MVTFDWLMEWNFAGKREPNNLVCKNLIELHVGWLIAFSSGLYGIV